VEAIWVGLAVAEYPRTVLAAAETLTFSGQVVVVVVALWAEQAVGVKIPVQAVEEVPLIFHQASPQQVQHFQRQQAVQP
jgi:phosphopantetheinyl transferase